MSRLVQIWEQSYDFKEEELEFFAKSQQELARPFQQLLNPPTTNNNNNNDNAILKKPLSKWEKQGQDIMSITAMMTNEDNGLLDHFDSKIDLNYHQARVLLSEAFIKIFNQLGEKVQELQSSHEQVKAKSLLMQSLWDGLVNRQLEFSKIVNQLQEALTPYLRYEMIHKVLLPVSKGEEDPLSITFCTVLQEAVKYYNILSLKMVDNLDAPLYVQRYQNIINQGIKSLLSSLLKELDQVTKLSSLRFREARLLQVLADVNAEFLLTSSKLSTPVVTLGTCCESFKEAGHNSNGIVQVAAKYFSCRSSLLHYFFTNWETTGDDGDNSTIGSISVSGDCPVSGKIIISLIELVHHILREERVIAERLFGPLLPSFSIQYKQCLETFLLPVLKKIRSTYHQEESDQVKTSISTICLDTITKLKKSSSTDDQRRVLTILTEFFSTAISPKKF